MTYKELKNEIYQDIISRHRSIKANKQMWFKSSIFLVGTVVTYILLMTNQFSGLSNIFLCTFMAVFIMGTMVNVLHDMIHDSYSTNSFFKNTFCYLSDIFGASSIVWKNKHNISHHYFTNNTKIDNDLNVSAVLRFSPNHKRYWFNKFQHVYIVPAYLLQCFFWYYISDFKCLVRRKITVKKVVGFTNKEIFLLFFLKALHIVIWLVIPSYVYGFKAALFGYIYVFAIVGLYLAVIFQVSHIIEGVKYHESDTFSSQDEWAKYQIEGSSIYAPVSWFGHWYNGGLNNQVTHHLFPEVCSIHYKDIYPIIEKYCQENKIEYPSFPSFYSIVSSHFKQIYLLGRGLVENDKYPTLD